MSFVLSFLRGIYTTYIKNKMIKEVNNYLATASINYL